MSATIIYDGDCPFCRNYVRLVRLRDSIGDVDLVNARDNLVLASELAAKGMDLDEGMVLILDGRAYHGAECVQRMALLSTPSGIFNRVNRFIFRRPRLARVLYPVLRAGRNATLAMLGVSKIRTDAEHS